MKRIVVLIVFSILFIIPLFWLKPGEMDLGGDGSRLYFYNPISYLKNHSLYPIAPSGFGGEVIGYWSIPFVSLLLFLRLLFSPTLVISLDHAMSLSIAFLASYLVIKEFFRTEKTEDSIQAEFASIIGGLFYAIAPGLIYGWDKVLMNHSQIFLNPLIFFLFLRYFKTDNFRYLVSIILISFLFAQNFGIGAIAPFFAFYPISMVFLSFYTKIILRKAIRWKHLLLAISLFLGVQMFQLFPHLIFTLSPGSSNYDAAFTSEGMYVRGLSYFTSVAREVKVSIYLMNLPQQTQLREFLWLFIVFPVLTIMGFYWNKRKTLTLTGFFFLFVFFMATANITDTFFEIYKLLFRIPGFAMFRNYYGQWQYVFIFFYALVLGQSLLVVFSKLKKRNSIIFSLFLLGIIVYGAFPLLNGSNVNKTLHESRNVKIPMVMDPLYEQTLQYIQNLPVDGKILTFPLADPGYQVLSGVNGGAYQGPSTIAYLTGKKDFIGFDDLGVLSKTFLYFVEKKDYEGLKNLLSSTNIRYLFHNSDPKIYDDTFPLSPYTHVRNTMPQTQEEYKRFLENLPIRKLEEFGGKYTVYEVDDANGNYLPHFYIPQRNIIYNNQSVLPLLTKTKKETIPVYFKFTDFIGKENLISKGSQLSSSSIHIDEVVDEVVLEANFANPLFHLRNNSHLHEHQPFVSNKIGSIFYPFILLREKYELKKTKDIPEKFIDFSLFILSKRVAEIIDSGEALPILYSEWKIPSFLLSLLPGKYKSWEAILQTYVDQENELVRSINNIDRSEDWKIAMKIKVKEQLLLHEKKTAYFIKHMGGEKTKEEKDYLITKTRKMFRDLSEQLYLAKLDPQTTPYEITFPDQLLGEYDVYMEDISIDLDPNQFSLDINEKPNRQMGNQTEKKSIRFTPTTVSTNKKTKILLHIPFRNLISNTAWQSGESLDVNTELGITRSNDIVRMNFSNIFEGVYAGYTQEIKDWKPKEQYLITFDYKTNGDDFLFRIYEKFSQKMFDAKTYAFKTSSDIRLIVDRDLNGKDWNTFQMALSANSSAEKAMLNIVPAADKSTSTIEIRNFSVVKVPYPQLIFKNTIGENQVEKNIPQILFTKINPTKYKVNVKNVIDPYVLVFLDDYNVNWRLFNVEKETESVKGNISRISGNMGRIISKIFGAKKDEGNEIAKNYSGGKISEGRHTNTFLSQDTFETWGKEEVSRNKHFVVNGYANGWIIEPSDVEGRTEYTLIVEMTRQKKFYFFLGVSLVFVAMLLAYFPFSFIKKHGKTN